MLILTVKRAQKHRVSKDRTASGEIIRKLTPQPIPDFVYPKNIRWQCTRCARCCGDVGNRERRIVMLPSEVTEICEYSGLKEEEFSDSQSENGPYEASMKKSKGKCVFLEDNNCRIYDARPLVCRFYPVWLSKNDSKYSFNVTHECPSIGQGTLLLRRDFASLLRIALDKRR
jgi:Fe-S-cluster containining protein